jgi:short-subunit dehydrogenase
MKETAVISGGTKGIGRAVVDKLASQGFHIITCARNTDDLEGVKEDIEKRFPDCEINVFSADLSDRQEVQKFVDFVLSNLDHVDVLVNNTGFFLPGEICNEPEGHLEQQINTNLYSAYYLTRGLVHEMKERKSGHIFNMCSIASITAYPSGGSYSISKFAMYGMSKVLREELKPHNIRVTALLPGATMTASWEGADVEEERLMKSEDVAEALWSAYSLSKNSVVEDIVIRPQLGDL